jgi:hypothetical protein
MYKPARQLFTFGVMELVRTSTTETSAVTGFNGIKAAQFII